MNVFKYKSQKKLKKKKKGTISIKKTKVYEEFGIKKQEGPKSNTDKQDGPKTKEDKEKEPLLIVSNKFDLLDEIQREQDEMADDEGYTIDKSLILQAWKRFRPVNKEKGIDGTSSPRPTSYSPQRKSTMRGRDKPRTKMILIEEIFGKKFLTLLMSEMHLKIYNFQERDD